MIIGISGKLGSGKDTFAAMLIEELNYNVEIKKFADKLKQTVSILSGRPIEDMYSVEGKNIFIEEFDMTVGTMQQKIGTNALRDNFDINVWVKSLFTSYSEDKNWIITDARFENEADYIKHLGGILIRIDGDPAKVRENSTRDLTHVSETSLDNYAFDLYIHNDGTLDDLRDKVKFVIQNYNLQKYNPTFISPGISIYEND